MQMYTIDEVAAKLKLHRTTVQQMAIDGRIPAIKVGRDWRVSQETLDIITINGIPVKQKPVK